MPCKDNVHGQLKAGKFRTLSRIGCVHVLELIYGGQGPLQHCGKGAFFKRHLQKENIHVKSALHLVDQEFCYIHLVNVGNSFHLANIKHVFYFNIITFIIK